MGVTDFRKGFVSIITPVYNAEKFLPTTITSVLEQTYKNFEYLLIDDCSSDESRNILADYAETDERIKVIKQATNQGAAVARNAGLEAAKGQYIAFIDSDDQWLPDKLAKQLDFMTTRQSAFSYTAFALLYEDGTVKKEKVAVPEKLNYSGLLKNTAIACSTVIIDRQMVGDFRMPLVRKGQDTATWLMLMRERHISADGLQEVLNLYRQVEGSISNNKLSALKRTWHTYYHLENLPFWRASYYFICYALNALRRRL